MNHGLSKQAAEVSKSCCSGKQVQALACTHCICATQDEAFLQNLLSWFQHNNGDACDCAMLDMLRKLAQQQGVSTKLCSLGLIAMLHTLQETGSPEVRRSADRTLTAVMQFDIVPNLQSASQYHISPQCPRSRCQSNSPPAIISPHQREHPHKSSQFQGRSTQHSLQSHRRNIFHRDSHRDSQTASQAFGSQQGKACINSKHQTEITLQLKPQVCP